VLLGKSYEALPSDAHRRMFLDAALLLHQQPAQHLTALWAAQLELDDSRHGAHLVLHGSGWRSRGRDMIDVHGELRRERQAHTCRKAADSLLDDLVSALLIVLDRADDADSLLESSASPQLYDGSYQRSRARHSRATRQAFPF
jgi:hypothetical protein